VPDSNGSPQSRPPWLPNLLLTFLLVTVAGGLITAYLQHLNDQQKALDEQRATTLQTYIDNMRDLLTHKLTESTQVVKVQTLATLRSLDADRNKTVLRFLQEEELIKNGFINLSNTDLSNDDLSGADLSGIDLNGATLTDTHLKGANLSGATLYGANLTGADLSSATLSNAFLFGARLNDANLSGATLINATLTGAFLSGTDMNHAVLTGAHLNGAILEGASLNGAYLSGASLSGANLTNADLSDADVSDANLATASFTSQQSGFTQQQLDEVRTCVGAILSKGLACRPIFCTKTEFLSARLAFTGPVCHQRPPIQLTYWYTENPAEAHVIKSLIGQFQQQYPYIQINAVNTNYFQTETEFINAADQAETEFINAAKEGDAPDVLRSDVGWVAEFASKNYLLDIDPYASQRDLPHYMNGPLGHDRYNGRLYGLPQVTDFLALLYNKAELESARAPLPSTMTDFTMTDFERIAEEVRRNHPRIYGFETDGTAYNVLPFLYAFGGGMFDKKDKQIMVSSDGSVRGLQFLLGLQQIPNLMPPNVNFVNRPASPIDTDFAHGNTAMIFGGPYDVKAILSDGFKASNLGVAGIPTCPTAADWPKWLEGPPTCRAGQTGSPAGGQSYVISADTTHPIEAYKFISFMSSPTSQAQIAEANGTLPTRKSVFNDGKLVVSGQPMAEAVLPPSWKPIFQEFQRLEKEGMGVDRPAKPQAGHLFDAFDPNIAEALDGHESAIAALKAVASAWEQLGV
jgi:arabinogalactan oligomer / maltooligosaccharide transport system substrate-binding protein